ncbi:MAG: hypothetical protein KDI17_02215 [Halioglobus sp.]|nr:hypothetical protein [Halioglobus sp.]
MDELDTPRTTLFPRRLLIEATVGLALLVLAFFAIASSDVSATGTRTYWTALVLIFAVTAFVSDRLHTGHSIGHLPSAVTITLHWLGVLLAIQLVHYFVFSGRMANADIGLTNGVLLALGSYLFGVYSNWRIAVIGLALAVATAGIAFIEEFIWFLFIVTAVAVLILFLGAKLFKHH